MISVRTGRSVPELQLSDEVLARLRADGGIAYDERGYIFVLTSIEFLQGRLEQRRHVTGVELSWACRDHALERFGLMARTVLRYWRIESTLDFGRIVYDLVRVGLLSTEPGDRVEDFEDVYDFSRAFDESYALSWPSEAQ